MKLKTTYAVSLLLICCIGTAMLSTSRTMPEFSTTSINKEPVSNKDFKDKVTLINFWATSCSSCIQEMSELTRLNEKYRRNGYRTLGIAMNYDNPDYIREFIKKHTINFTIVHDLNNQLANDFGKITLVPSSFLINKKGKIIKKIVGEINTKELEILIKESL